MVSKSKALYQVKLILDYLPEDEYKLIPEETIDYIEENFEYDENFTINPKILLEKQKIDNFDLEILKLDAKLAKLRDDLENEEETKETTQMASPIVSTINILIEEIQLRKKIKKFQKTHFTFFLFRATI